jgi:hypothetical protein
LDYRPCVFELFWDDRWPKVLELTGVHVFDDFEDQTGHSPAA